MLLMEDTKRKQGEVTESDHSKNLPYHKMLIIHIVEILTVIDFV